MRSRQACLARRLAAAFGIVIGLSAFPAEAHGQG